MKISCLPDWKIGFQSGGGVQKVCEVKVWLKISCLTDRKAVCSEAEVPQKGREVSCAFVQKSVLVRLDLVS